MTAFDDEILGRVAAAVRAAAHTTGDRLLTSTMASERFAAAMLDELSARGVLDLPPRAVAVETLDGQLTLVDEP